MKKNNIGTIGFASTGKSCLTEVLLKDVAKSFTIDDKIRSILAEKDCSKDDMIVLLEMIRQCRYTPKELVKVFKLIG